MNYSPLTRIKKHIVFFALLSLLAGIILLISGNVIGYARDIPPLFDTLFGTPTPTPEDDRQQIKSLIETKIQGEDSVLGYFLYDVKISSIDFSGDHQWALIWLHFFDQKTKALIPTEPGLAIGSRGQNGWQIWLPSDIQWEKTLLDIPKDLAPDDLKENWLEQYQMQIQSTNYGPYDGYLLPWAGGVEKRLTRSISHGVGGSMHYSFDFSEDGIPSAMFPIYAAKAGIVRFAEWTYPNGYYDWYCNHANYLVIEHPTTDPTTYTLYLHLAHDSIPPELRIPGAAVAQGEYIGVADDTGCSTGNHLHIQTHINPNSFFGWSVDMTFDDVQINGGRPRTPDEARWYPGYGAEGEWFYTSGNTIRSDFTPPNGEVTSPGLGDIAQDRIIRITGWGMDAESSISQIKLLGYYDDDWRQIAPTTQSSTFVVDWDMCADNVPDGPVSLAMEIWDMQGNIAPFEGLQHFTKNYTCPPEPPQCSTGENDIALFAEPSFGGECSVLPPGDYNNSAMFGEVGIDNTESIQLGGSVMATLYADDDFLGRSETVIGQDSNLADNLLGANQLSSLRVLPIFLPPETPILRWPEDGSAIPDTNPIYLFWQDTGGGTEFQVQLMGNSTITYDWQEKPFLHLPSLPPGTYSWRVRSQNTNGESGWSLPWDINIQNSSPANPPTFTAPYFDDMETGNSHWTATGLWHWAEESTFAYSGSYSWWYGDPTIGNYDTADPNTGGLTSPFITIPAPGYSLRFWYRYQTESSDPNWDQRLVQISVNGGPFENLVQFFDDESNYWLKSQDIDLSNYAGQTIQLRFTFATFDDRFNNYMGWLIDDVEIAQQSSPVCNDINEPNQSATEATAITYGTTVSGDICPSGDVDYFTFQGAAGDRIAFDIDAESQGSLLDSYLFLYDSDGSSLLAENDDEILYIVHDSNLGYLLPRDGIYYLKVRAWDHPGVGGPAFNYHLKLSLDSQDPIASLSQPTSGEFLPTGVIPIVASVQDNQSGISHVDFYWHSYDWLNSEWQLIEEDWDGQDGWQTEFDTTSMPESHGLAFYAKVYDWAGNWIGTGSWENGIDRSAPETNMQSLPPTQETTAVYLQWTGTDNISGIDHIDIQVKRDLEEWQDYLTGLNGNISSVWFVGEQDHFYAFRVRAVDRAGNSEIYNPDGDTLTYLSPCSNPDIWEPDNSQTSANELMVNGENQRHNICLPSDADWLKISMSVGTHYQIFISPLDTTTSGQISLFDTDGSTLIKEVSPARFGQSSHLFFTAPQTGVYYVRIRHIDGNVAGNGVAYLVRAQEGYHTHLPVINR